MQMVKLTKDGKTISMPHMMDLRVDLYRKYSAFTRATDKAQKIEDDKEKALALYDTQDLLFEIIDLTRKFYPQYAAWSEEFSMRDHLKTYQSISKGYHKIDISEEMETDFLEE